MRLILIATSGRVVAYIDPLNILLALRHSILLERCPHSCHAPLKHSIPSHASLQTSARAVDNPKALRCFALASCGEPSVLRRSSCPRCYL